MRVHRVVSAIDCGHVVNPLTVELQTQSAVAFGLTAALYGEISIQDGAVRETNFHDYRMLRMAEMLVDMKKAGMTPSRRGFYWAKLNPQRGALIERFNREIKV